MTELVFQIEVRHPESRRIRVAVEFTRSTWPADESDLGGDGGLDRTLFLPTWTPGSYLIREYSRHLGPVAAHAAETGNPIPVSKIAKNRYRLRMPAGCDRVRLSYDVYAHDLTVRTADLTPEHAFWNHACLLLWPVGQRSIPARILIRAPQDWQVACSLTPADGRSDEEWAFLAKGIDEVMDSPVLCGYLQVLTWTSAGVPHQALLEGLDGVSPPDRLVSDLARISDCVIALFGGDVPYLHYSYLCLFTDSGHGGLEHANCSVLLSPRTALRPGKAYQELLGLAAHELIHAWNVKRMRPQDLWVYDYEAENHTSLLWLVEGWTAYYDDLLCVRAGVLPVEDYLAILGRNLTAMSNGRGRLRQSLAESSFDAWIRFYRPDENTRNSTQNYYVNGAIAALCLDLKIRVDSDGQRSLDQIMRGLWQITWQRGRGYTRTDVDAVIRAVGGEAATQLLAQLVDGPLDPQLEPLLTACGVQTRRKDLEKPYLGIGFRDGTTTVAFVQEDGPAARCGIAPGDEFLALDGLRVTHDNWTEVFQAKACVERPLAALTASRGVVRERTVVPTSTPAGSIELELVANPDAAARRLRAGWLGLDAS